MKKLCALLLLLGTVFAAPGQSNVIVIDENLLQAAQAWAEENLDEDVLRTLKSGDQKQVKEFLDSLQKEFQAEYVIDLAQLKNTANVVLPILESYEETEPYALWLKSRLDYLETAEDLRSLTPPVKPDAGKSAPPAPQPQPSQVREVWIKKVAQRPWPDNARTYVAKLKPIFVEEKIPAELVWIAEVESSFNPRAFSPAGAAGLFQLMPATAKQYGLRTWPFDQRLRPEESARAAAKHLRYLHGKFKDWRLALAAYNAGEGRVQTLLTRHKADSFDAIAARLPAETQMYVPKIEATLLRREGVTLSQLGRPTAVPSR